MQRLKDKVAIITGSTSGMGYETARVFAMEGAKVIITGRRQERIDQLLAEAQEKGWQMAGITADFTDAGFEDKIVDFALETFGTVDILVNNAGVIDRCYTTLTMPDEVIDDVMNTNVVAPIKMCRKVLPILLEKKAGNIINIVSMCGVRGFLGGPVYTTSKWALRGFTKNIAYQYANTGVRINAVNPGPFPTEVMSRWAFEDNGNFIHDARFGEKFGPIWPTMCGEGNNQDISYACVYLASDEAHFVNGAEITVDGGCCCA